MESKNLRSPLHILLTYEQEIIGEAMKWLLEKHVPLGKVREARDYKTILGHLASNEYDLIILDTELQREIHLMSAVDHIKSLSPTIKILMFSALDEVTYTPMYIAYGTHGFLSKKANISGILSAIETVLRGEIFINEPALAHMNYMDSEQGKFIKRNPFNILSTREAQIAELLIEGDTLIEISRKMNLRETTVSTYKKRIFKKANVKNIPDLINLRGKYNL